MRGDPRPFTRELERIVEEHQLTILKHLQTRSSHDAAIVRVPDGPRFLLKLERYPGEAERELRALRRFWPTGRVPDALPLGDGALLVRWIQSETLEQSTPSPAADAYVRVGEALRQLHSSAPDDLVTWERLEDRVAARHDRIMQTQVLPVAVRRVADEAWRALEGTPADGQTLLHGDAHSGNVLLPHRAPSVVFIDPYGLCGDPMYDAAFVAAYDREDVRTALATTLRGYCADAEDACRAELWLRWLVVYRWENSLKYELPAFSARFQTAASALLTK